MNDLEPKVKFDHFNDFHDVAFRILLVDDKVGCDQLVFNKNGQEYKCKDGFVTLKELRKTDCIFAKKEKRLVVERCPDVDCIKTIKEKDPNCQLQCKLCTLKRLMDNGHNEDGKKDLFDGIGDQKDYFFWQENEVECYYCPTLIKDFIDNDFNFDGFDEIVVVSGDENNTLDNSKHKLFKIVCDFGPALDCSDQNKPQKDQLNKVQIVGVRDVRTALLLLSKYKFDMIFFDYLLDYKDESQNERDYSIQFFKFISTNFTKKKDDSSKIIKEAQQVNDKQKEEEEKKKLHKYETLEKLQFTLLRNRGPLDKLWIMPITGFNSPFITALQNDDVPLISYRWHIDNGADPITTPWQFLVKLNQFIELQLKGCVYDMETLLQFLTISGTNIKRRLPLPEDGGEQNVARFHDFQDLMGAEFSNFMMRFGARPLIRRDALTGEEVKNDDTKSVFSTYVWRKFYTDMSDVEEVKRKKKKLFSLHNLMQIFYQVAATMPEDRNGVLRLREAFRRMRYYVDINDLKTTLEDAETKNNLDNSLKYFANRIDSLLVEKEEKPIRKKK